MAETGRKFRLEKEGLDRLLDALNSAGYRSIAALQRDGTVMWETISSADALPWNRREDQRPGHYRLNDYGSGRCFDITHGPQSLKPLTFAPREPLTTVRRDTDCSTLTFYPQKPVAEKIAVLGARACDIAALAIQQRVLEEGEYTDPFFTARKDALFIVAVHCTRAAETCFCASMGCGPKAESGFDIALTELDELFLIESGSRQGETIVAALALPRADAELIDRAEGEIQACAASQSRGIDQQGLPQALYEAHNHPHWDDVASRCLSCTNCTMVCPTCFCHAVEEVPSMDRSESDRFRVWDSCFSPEHGYIHGKNMRPTTRERYRMWMTHKLGSWIGQFGTSGCVGCGRCTTWCPAGIDFVEEYRQVRREA
ncbi:MAG: 4Fe-4S dicluster domain-containing protein [Mariprofundaceae bacterium]|nr:4Fe-4S dicluster domain-containing protein [Mariprofundaceae bacterium]